MEDKSAIKALFCPAVWLYVYVTFMAQTSAMKNSITICLLSAVLLACSYKSYSQWTPLTSGTTEYLHSIYFKDQLKGYCAGGGDYYAYPVNGTTGVILKTNDGGTTWNTVYEDTLIAMHAVVALEDTVTAFGTDEFGQWISMRSTNDGYSWVKDTTAYVVKDICYYNDELYFIDDSSGGELKRISQGVVQSVQPDALLFDINETGEIFCITYSTSMGYHFDLLASDDDGATWDTMNVDAPIITANSLTNASLWAFGDTIVFYATYPAAIAYSYNKGVSWNYFNLPAGAPGSGAYLLSPDVLIGKVHPNQIMGSSDGGHVFAWQDSTTARISHFHFVDEQTGFLCGEDGIIYKTSNAGGITSVKESGQQANSVVVYPNPVKDIVQLRCAGRMKINSVQVLDVTGRQVQMTTEDVQTIDMRNLAPGSYILLIDTNAGQTVRKIVK